MNYKIILASNSPRRKEILSRYIENFSIMSSEYEENIDVMGNPKTEVMKAALLKGMSIVDQATEPSLIISADTVVYYETILGKPQSEEDARKMLKMLSGQWHEVFTGFAIIDSESNKSIINYEKTKVKFNILSDEMIDWYISSKEYFDKAGSYGIQGLGAILVDEISGDYFNVVGLPISKLHFILDKHFDFNILTKE
ncbi:MAG: septum formation protein Maf [Clostridiales bacterium]|nr:septum formation protein Maf [Clostridiales bacterium]